MKSDEIKGYILIVDDNVSFAEKLKTELQKHNYKIELAHSYNDALFKLSNNYFNLALLDVSLIEKDSSDRQGIELAKYINTTFNSIAVICMSRPTYVKTNDLVEILNPDEHGKRIAYLFCEKFDLSKLINFIELTYKNYLNINYNYKINYVDFDSILSKCKLIPVDTKYSTFHEIEIDESIRKLIYNNYEKIDFVEVERMGKGRSRSVVIKVNVNYINKNSNKNYILKIASNDSINMEVNNYKKNVLGFMPSNSYPFLTEICKTKSFSGLIYTVVGNDNGKEFTFNDSFENLSQEVPTTFLKDLYWNILSCKERPIQSHSNIFLSYKTRFPQLEGSQIVDSLNNFLKYEKNEYIKLTDKSQKIKIKFTEHSVPNPINALLEYPFLDSEFQESITHGDLHGDNILFDSKENIVLIDFAHTKKHHSLIDYIIFEISLKINLLKSKSITFEQLIYLDLGLNSDYAQMSNKKRLSFFLEERKIKYLYEFLFEIRKLGYAASCKKFWLSYYKGLIYCCLALVNIGSFNNDIKNYLISLAGISLDLLFKNESDGKYPDTSKLQSTFDSYFLGNIKRRISDVFVKNNKFLINNFAKINSLLINANDELAQYNNLFNLQLGKYKSLNDFFKTELNEYNHNESINNLPPCILYTKCLNKIYEESFGSYIFEGLEELNILDKKFFSKIN